MPGTDVSTTKYFNSFLHTTVISETVDNYEFVLEGAKEPLQALQTSYELMSVFILDKNNNSWFKTYLKLVSSFKLGFDILVVHHCDGWDSHGRHESLFRCYGFSLKCLCRCQKEIQSLLVVFLILRRTNYLLSICLRK